MLDLDKNEIHMADVIFATNKITGAETIYYGRSMIELIANGYELERELYVVHVPVDFSDESEEPEQLAAACLAWKGSCDALEEAEE
jgi:hypothetical protein